MTVKGAAPYVCAALVALAEGGLSGAVAGTPPAARDVNAIAEEFVRLALALGHHDPDGVDSYYGPPEWKREAEAQPLALAEIERRAGALVTELDATGAPAPADPLRVVRRDALRQQLVALGTRAAMVGGRRLPFDEESQRLYGATAPARSDAFFDDIIRRVAARLPGEGALVDRFNAYRKQFLIPADKLDGVFRAAIAECRRRTLAHMALPAGESFTVEYVRDKPWGGYNWYRGASQSLIQVNTDLPTHIDRAVDLACHEGYPGHHVLSTLTEQRLVRERGWVELSVFPLFSPQSLVAEGTANFGPDLAFPGEERTAFEKAVLFPLAGLDPRRADEYYQIKALVEDLRYAGSEAARRFLDGQVDAGATVDWLVSHGLVERSRAEKLVRFIERYRSYVITYAVGLDRVRDCVEARSGPQASATGRWREFEWLVLSPALPAGSCAESSPMR